MRPARVSIACAAVLATLLEAAPSNAAARTPAGHARPGASAQSAARPSEPTHAPRPGAPTRHAAWVARIIIPTPAMTAPGIGHVRTVIPTSATGNGGPMDLLVLGARQTAKGTTWLRVLLPQRPNGTSAWIDSNLVGLTRTPWRIDVSRPARTVSLLRNGRIQDTWSAVIGKPSTPTPPGMYAIYERVRQPSPERLPRHLGPAPHRILTGAAELRRRPRPSRNPRTRGSQPAGPARQRPIARLHPDRQQRRQHTRGRSHRRHTSPSQLTHQAPPRVEAGSSARTADVHPDCAKTTRHQRRRQCPP